MLDSVANSDDQSLSNPVFFSYFGGLSVYVKYFLQFLDFR